jgi:hypothetical protein
MGGNFVFYTMSEIHFKKIEIKLPIFICWRDSKRMDEIRIGWILSG